MLAVAPIGTFAIVAEAATGFGSTVLSELPIDLEALYARRLGTNPCILRIPVFPTVQGEELERMTLYALARELDLHARGTAEGPVEHVCENPYDALVLSDFQVGTPGQRRDELARFLGSLAGFFRPPPVNLQDNPLVRHKTKGPWRRGFRDLVALWKGGGWADFRYRRMVKEMEKEPPAPPLVDQEPFRAGRRLYLELDVRYRRLLGATPLDYPGRISPDDAGSLAELAEQLLEQGRDRDAFDAYQAAAEARPDQPENFEGLARAALLLGETEEALKNYTLTVQLDPDRAGAHEGIILCYLRLGRHDLARDHLALTEASGCKIDPELAKRL
jgi:tetratricopeptide (TPR) repeat protein